MQFVPPFGGGLVRDHPTNRELQIRNFQLFRATAINRGQTLMQSNSSRSRPHFARYTIFPATIVHNTFVSRISSGEAVKTSRSSKTKSARLPAAIIPMESRFMASAELRVEA